MHILPQRLAWDVHMRMFIAGQLTKNIKTKKQTQSNKLPRDRGGAVAPPASSAFLRPHKLHKATWPSALVALVASVWRGVPGCCTHRKTPSSLASQWAPFFRGEQPPAVLDPGSARRAAALWRAPWRAFFFLSLLLFFFQVKPTTQLGSMNCFPTM